MMEILKTYGGGFSPQWWKDLFAIIFRIFDDKKLQGMHTAQDRTTWMNTTCNHALRSVVDVVTMYFDVLQDVLLKETFDLLKWCIHKSNEQLARTGTECLHIIVMSNGTKFTDASWQLACELITGLFDTTAPKELHNYAPEIEATPAADGTEVDAPDGVGATAPSSSSVAKMTAEEKEAQQADFELIIIKCVVQLELIQTVEWILLSSTNPNTKSHSAVAVEDEKKVVPREVREKIRAETLATPMDEAGEMFACISSARLSQLLGCLMTSHEFAKDFNANKPLRMALWKAGFMRNRANIIEVCHGTLERFVVSIPPEARHVWAPYIALILREILDLDEARFKTFGVKFYDLWTETLVLAYDQKLGQIVFFLAKLFARTKSISL